MMIDKNMKLYLRFHPKWYLLLSRYPECYKDVYEQYKIENKLTLADRIEKIGLMISMIDMLL